MKSFYIKERHNLQLGAYYVPMGQLTRAESRLYDKSRYGFNVMHRFLTEETYLTEIQRLKMAGQKVREA